MTGTRRAADSLEIRSRLTAIFFQSRDLPPVRRYILLRAILRNCAAAIHGPPRLPTPSRGGSASLSEGFVAVGICFSRSRRPCYSLELAAVSKFIEIRR